MMFKYSQVLITMCLLIHLTRSEKGYRKAKESQHNNSFEVFSSDILPSDAQITSFLTKGIKKTFYFWSTVNNGSMSVTIVTCSSPITWYINTQENDSVGSYSMPMRTTLDMTTAHFTSSKSVYKLEFLATDNDTYLHVYISTEIGGPRTLQETRNQKIQLFKKRRSITVKWQHSFVDPQNTNYCLIIDNKKIYKTQCSAQAEKTKMASSDFSGIKTNLELVEKQIGEARMKKKPGEDTFPIIACVGQKLHYTLNNLGKYEQYHFSLFATNLQNNFTYPFGNISSKFKDIEKPIALKDGKLRFLKLRQSHGETVLRFKVPRSSGNVLKICLASCEAKIKVIVSKKGKRLVTKNITRYSLITIPSVEVGGRYSIKISTVNHQEIENSAGIQIFASAKPHFKLPFPLMPSDTMIREYESLKSCSSVTVGWYPPVGTNFSHYCFFVKEGDVRDANKLGKLRYCGNQKKLRMSEDFVVNYCKDIDHRDQKVVTETIHYLQPSRKYMIQIVAKKPQGKSLPYDLFHTQTLPRCS